MLEQKIDELIVAINALTQRLETNNQSDAYRKAKAIEDEPELPTLKTETVSVKTEAANDPTLDDLLKLGVNFSTPPQIKSIVSLLDSFGAKRIQELDKASYGKFYKDASALLEQAS